MIARRVFPSVVPAFLFALLGAARVGAQAQRSSPRTIVVRNNHDVEYRGPLELPVPLADGGYRGAHGAAEVRGGVARAVVRLAAHAEDTLRAVATTTASSLADGPLSVTPSGESLRFSFNAAPLGALDLGLVVISGTSATIDDAIRGYTPLPIVWTARNDGMLAATATRDGYRIAITAAPYGDGAIDLRARLVRRDPAAAPAFVALVRRVVTPGAADASLRFNGRVSAGAESPGIWDRDFWYVRGVDWLSWRAGSASLVAVNGFTPAPTILRDTAWVESSHFYVWERTRQRADTMYLVSEIAGPNAEQAKSRYMPVTPYAPIRQGDSLALKWRLAVASSAPRGVEWQESQLRAFAGYRAVATNGAVVVADIGVRSVTFGTAYFPYSTLAENFDYYRTPGLSSETFWPTSPLMWAQWRRWQPRMRSDLRIIRSMGFEEVRLHHLELLQRMKRAEALAFLDFFTAEARSLGLKLVIDTEGPAAWVTTLLSRYHDVVARLEIENEILIYGIKPADPVRWSSLYAAAKAAAPATEVFFTTAGNNGMFERLRTLGVPFDRVGLHAYKHGPQWIEAYSSHVLGTSGYASDIGKPMTLGEFNWKDLTRMSPEARRPFVAAIWDTVLSVRAVPELIEFQFQESISFNPSVAGSNSRHYEPLTLDRRPKPEAAELLRVIRRYTREDAPVRTVGVTIAEAVMAGAREASFTLVNRSARTLTLRIEAVALDGIRTSLRTPSRVTLAPGDSTAGRLALALPAGALPGLYHHFLRVRYDGGEAWGWGIASNAGAPAWTPTSVLKERVKYAQGLDVVKQLDWTRPIAVAYGDKSSVLELEMAYQISNTLQSATGKPVRVSSVSDLPDSIAARGLVLLVGTPATNALVGSSAAAAAAVPAGTGLISLDVSSGRQWLALAGRDAKGAEAAVVELQLRYWPHAKDATIRITGMEQGAALGRRAGGSAIDLP